MFNNFQLTKEKETKIKETFYLVDSDKDDLLLANEVGLTLRALGIILSEEEILNINSEIENEYNGKIDYKNFRNLYIEKMKSNISKNVLIKAFKQFDKENTGYVNLNEMKHALMTLGEILNEEEFDILKNEIITDNKGNFKYSNLIEDILGNN